MNILDTLWVEKFRPKRLSDLVLTDEHRKYFIRFISQGEISNLLFSGPPGSGKTTIARIITSKNGILQNKNDNLLEINGSAKETRGISFVQDVIEPFLKIPPLGNDKCKVVYIDEADHLCLRGDQEVFIIDDDCIKSVKIEDLCDREDIKVLSMDIENKVIEVDNATYVDSGFADMFEVVLENEKTIVCSGNHPFFVLKGSEIIEKKLRDIDEDDKIIDIEGVI